MSNASRVVKAGHAMYYGGLVAKLDRELAEAREDAANQRRLADLALAHRDVIIAERDTLAEALRVTWEDIDHLKYWMPLPCCAKSQLALAAAKGGSHE